MTEYVYGMTFACPVAYIDAANDLFAWVGYSYGDHGTFFVKTDDNDNPDPWVDENGVAYAMANGRFKKEFAQRLGFDLTSYPIPDWCYDNGDPETGTLLIDPVAATEAQSIIALLPEDSAFDPENVISQAGPGYIYVQLRGYQAGDLGIEVRQGPIPIQIGPVSFDIYFRGVMGQVWLGVDWNQDGVVDIWTQYEGQLDDETAIRKAMGKKPRAKKKK